MEIVLPKLEQWQEVVHNSMSESRGSGKIYVVKAKRQCGKSILAIVELLKFAFEKKCTNVILEPTLNQSRRVFKQITDLLDGTKLIQSANGSLLTIEFINGSEIIFKSAEQRDALRGFTVTGLLVIDEGAFIADDIYEIVFPTTDANSAPILIISTPLFEDGLFYTLFIKGLDKSVTRIESFNWNEYDTSKYLSGEALEMYRQTLTPQKFKSEYLGEFISDGSYVFGNIKQCLGYSTNLPKYAGIDWATGKNGDDTVVTLIDDDGAVVGIECLNNMDSTEQIDRIVQYLNQYPSIEKIQVEINSIGSVFYDLLKRKYKKPIIEFNTSNESKRRIIEQLIKAFEGNKIKIPNDKKLIEELQHYEMQKLSKGYTYNAQSGYHDDYVISLALAFDMCDNSIGEYVIGRTHKKEKRLRLRDKYEKG